jgi:hypothetical protein
VKAMVERFFNPQQLMNSFEGIFPANSQNTQV